MMSNFKIVHEIDGRLRVRFGQYAFTNEQATILKSDFLKLEYVRYVEAHYKNGSLLLVFDENYKNEVFLNQMYDEDENPINFLINYGNPFVC